MEVLQLWVPGRHSAIIDAVVSSLGGLLGIALGALVLGLAAQAYKKHRMTVSGFTITQAFTMRGEIR
jgi:VanZ family protein